MKVGIIVPIYNVEQYLRKCIESLINQTYSNIEILLVNDGSPDNSIAICDEYVKKDKRINVINKENGGYGSVLELAINTMTSDYFLICDPDDWLELDAVEKLVNASKKYDVDLVVARKKLVYSDGSIKSDINDFKKIAANELHENLNEFVLVPCSPHAKLYKTKFCKDIVFPKKINNTDFLLYHVYLSKISRAVYIDEELANYYIDRPGNSFNEDIKVTDKSLKSNVIVTYETYRQMNKKSNIYPVSIMHLFVRSCIFLVWMHKYNMYNSEYYSMLDEIIIASKLYKNNLYMVLSRMIDSKIKCCIKFILYRWCYNSIARKMAIMILSI